MYYPEQVSYNGTHYTNCSNPNFWHFYSLEVPNKGYKSNTNITQVFFIIHFVLFIYYNSFFIIYLLILLFYMYSPFLAMLCI